MRHVIKARAADVEVICVQPLGAPTMTLLAPAARLHHRPGPPPIADGVAGRRLIPAVLEDLLLVADDAA